MKKDSNILIIGHDDIIEGSLVQYFTAHGFEHVFSCTAMAMNATIQASVYDFFAQHRPEYIFLSSTRSGGIEANQRQPAEFIYHNLESQNNIVYAAWKFGAKKLLYLASSCVYPRECPQPMRPEYLLAGELEKTSEAYAIAKIAGIKLCQAYRRQYGLKAMVAIPATVYGPGSETDLISAHVMGALIHKFTEAIQAKTDSVTVWGSGCPQREFLYVDDFVQACLYLMEHYDDEEIVNIGTSLDVSIKELAQIIGEVVGFHGKIYFDESKPDGTMRKLLDSTYLAKLGWRPKVSLREGIERTYAWYNNKKI